MKTFRAMLVGLTSATLIGVPGAAMASAPVTLSLAASSPASLQLAVARHRTSIRFLDTDHIKPAGATGLVRGQVVGSSQGTRGALAGVQVKLYRQLDGSRTWTYLGSRVTDDGAFPRFAFSVLARQNAHYRVVFGGNDGFLPTEKSTWLSVYRVFNGAIADGPAAATLHGHVSPYYTHKDISLQKSSCDGCDYVTVKHAVTGVDGAYSFSLPAPAQGKWWWRLTIPKTVAYIASIGSTFSTERK